MLAKSEQYFDQMLKELVDCKKKNLQPEQEVECCYTIVEAFWFKVKSDLLYYKFLNTKEKITFFKKVKPKFLSEKEYYSLLYHAALFLPKESIVDQKAFWIRESRRLEKFIIENKEFYDYIKSGGTNLDKFFFFNEEVEDESYFEMSHSRLLGILYALERYDEYVKERLKMVSNMYN